MTEQVFVALSGGVDSSVAAALLLERGEDVVGVWMRLTPGGAETDAPRCCGTDEAGEDARRAAAKLGIPFYALDYAEVFGRQVIDRFVDAYASGETPNPCVSCNHHVKFDALLRDVVAKFGGTRLATGHYARVADAPDGTRRLLRARDTAKDQSYALYMLGQRELRRTLFPVGELANKTETREIAARFDLPTATKAESMDICFVANDYRDLVRSRAPRAFEAGPVERVDGSVVGQHAGIGGLTVGQRSGTGVATGERLYVLRLEPQRSAAVVGTREEITRTTYELRDVSFTSDVPPGQAFDTSAVLRYRGTPLAAAVDMIPGGALLQLAAPALVAPGQAVVFYRGDEVLGGGIVRAGSPG